MMPLFLLFASLAGMAVASPAFALETVTVADGVFAIVGDIGQRSKENLGSNATFGAVVTADGVVLIDAGATVKGAAAIDAELRKVTDRPVVAVIDTGGQDHRWLGNSYWKAKGARIISSAAAVADQRARFDVQWMGLTQLVGAEGIQGTEPVYATETFETGLDLVIGGVSMRLIHPGRAHTPGDLIVWLPGQRIAFSGDIVFTGRMLGILPAPVSTSGDWIKAFDTLAALDPRVIVPGHGRPASLEQARRDTRDYLAHLRAGVKAVLERKGDMIEAGKIDQSAFNSLPWADQLAGRNAQAVFAEMEFEE